MKMITNYLNTLESYLPEESREEIRQEFESSLAEQIDDKNNALGREMNEQEQESLLLEIGHPMRVAAGYLPHQELIGSGYFPAYKQALQIALSVFAVITLLSTIPFKLNNGGIFTAAFSVFWNVAEVSLDVFLVVTGVFFLMQRYEFDLNELYSWSPKKLSARGKKISLSRFGVFFEMLFEALFLVVWNQLFFAKQVWIEHELIQNFSMSSEWSAVFIAVNFAVGGSFILNIFKLVNAHWDRWLLQTNIGIDAVSLALLAYILQFDQYLILDSTELGGYDWPNLKDVAELNIRIVIGFIMAVTLWDGYSHYKNLHTSSQQIQP